MKATLIVLLFFMCYLEKRGQSNGGAETRRVYSVFSGNHEEEPDLPADKNSLSFNFINLFNHELGFAYKLEFYENDLCLIIPFAAGYSDPQFTQRIYFDKNIVFSESVTLDRKRYEFGLGVNYFPTKKTFPNYYIGPVIRYMQFYAMQESRSRAGPIIWNNTLLSRYAISITNGLNFKGKSGITSDIFISLGIKKDFVKDPLRTPLGKEIATIRDPISFYIWSGFLVGFGF